MHATGAAIHELMMTNGGTLKEGKYRCRPLYGGTQEWSHLTLSSTGYSNPES